MKLTLTDKKNLEGDIHLFTFTPEKLIMWKAGQQMVFTLPLTKPDNLGGSRTLSIASAPFEKNIVVLTHCGDLASSFKKALKDMRVGDEIEAGDPYGAFTIQNPTEDHTFIAAGVGIAPFRSILLDLDYHNQPLNCMLFYSHSTEKFPFKDEIEELLERHTNFKVFYTIDPNEIERGRIRY
jgi:ferredoxin-NADP reductase